MREERILGTGDFVERVLSESGEPLRYRSGPVEQSKRLETILKGECQFRECGAIGKAVRDAVGRGGYERDAALIIRLHPFLFSTRSNG
jgi:hypothetical protein